MIVKYFCANISCINVQIYNAFGSPYMLIDKLTRELQCILKDVFTRCKYE